VTTFATTAHVALRVSLSAGEVTVETAEQPGVEIDLVPLRDNDITRQAIAAARIGMTDRRGGHEIVVQIPKKPGLSIGRSPKVGVRILCPVGSDLQLRADSADLDATGSLGAVDVKTASGDVTVVDATSVDVDTASGDLRVRDIIGTADFKTASGDATLHRCGGLLSASLVSGDLAVGEAGAGLSVTTVSGDVRIDAAGGGKMQIQAVSGDVHLGIKPGERLYIDASSVSGKMASELDLADAPPADAGAPVAELRIRTVSGDARIVRAALVGA
jgi:hypothetical protein